MAHRSRLLIAAALVGAALPACGDTTAPSHLARLPGAWDWVSSFDLRTQQVHTPATEGYAARLEFTPRNQRAGTFTYSREGRTPVHGMYDIASEDAPGNDFIRLSASIDFLTEVAWISVGPDTLRLGGVMELGHNSAYARRRD